MSEAEKLFHHFRKMIQGVTNSLLNTLRELFVGELLSALAISFDSLSRRGKNEIICRVDIYEEKIVIIKEVQIMMMTERRERNYYFALLRADAASSLCIDVKFLFAKSALDGCNYSF